MDGYDSTTYGDGFADVYDEWYADVSDVDATVETLARWVGEVGGAVLELGVGTGRLALPLAERGIDVWGVDASAAMVGRLRVKPGGDRVTVVVTDMADLDLSAVAGGAEAEFGVVFAAFNTFFNVTTEQDQRRCLHRVARVLGARGRLALEAFVPGDDERAGAVEPLRVAVDHVVLSMSRRRPESQVVDGQHVEITEQGIRLRPWVIRYASPEQLDEMAAGAGLRLRDRWETWDGAAFHRYSPTHVSVYERDR